MQSANFAILSKSAPPLSKVEPKMRGAAPSKSLSRLGFATLRVVAETGGAGRRANSATTTSLPIGRVVVVVAEVWLVGKKNKIPSGTRASDRAGKSPIGAIGMGGVALSKQFSAASELLASPDWRSKQLFCTGGGGRRAPKLFFSETPG